MEALCVSVITVLAGAVATLFALYLGKSRDLEKVKDQSRDRELQSLRDQNQALKALLEEVGP